MGNGIPTIDSTPVRGKPAFLKHGREKVVVTNCASDVRLRLRPHVCRQRRWILTQSNIWSNPRVERHRLDYLFLRRRSPFCCCRYPRRQNEIVVAIEEHEGAGRQMFQRQITKIRRKFGTVDDWPGRHSLRLLTQDD